MKHSGYFLVVITSNFLLVLSGCETIIPPTMYEATSTKISYDLSYGFQVNCSGTGQYEILYRCDIPEVLNGSVTYDILYPEQYQRQTMFNNSYVQWKISGYDEHVYRLGLKAHVVAESYLYPDIQGENVLSIQELARRYPVVFKQYTQLQGNETTQFIDPMNPDIVAIAANIQQQADQNNTFVLAKAVFTWLKQHIQYQTHPNESGVQPVSVTLARGTGDCDDLSFLYVSLCRACQIPARYIRGFLITNNGNGSVTATAHAWTEVFIGGMIGNKGWLPVECSCVVPSIDSDIDQNFGVESAFHLRLFTDDGSNASLILSFSSISYSYGVKRVIGLQSFTDITNYSELESKHLLITKKGSRYYE